MVIYEALSPREVLVQEEIKVGKRPESGSFCRGQRAPVTERCARLGVANRACIVRSRDEWVVRGGM